MELSMLCLVVILAAIPLYTASDAKRRFLLDDLFGTRKPTTPNYVYHQMGQSCKTTAMDVVFLLDSSGSEGPSNFEKQKQFVAGFAKSFMIGPNHMQISVLSFSTNVYSEFHLNEYDTTPDLLQAIDKITYKAGGTRTDLGLHAVGSYALQPNHGDRASAPDVLIVMTDGQSVYDYETYLEAKRLRSKGVVIFALGIGNSVSSAELHNIAGSNQRMFRITSFNDLPTFLHVLENALCKTVIGPSCSDRIRNFKNYIGDICHSSKYRDWMLHNCPHFCGECDAAQTTRTSTTTTTTTTRTTTTPATTTTPLDTPAPPTGPVVCEDKEANCAAYGEQVCTDKRHWAVLNCARFCLFCHDNATHHPPLTTRAYDRCVDKVEYCADEGKEVCTKYPKYAADNCPAFCNFCIPESTTPAPTTTTPKPTTTTTTPSTTTPTTTIPPTTTLPTTTPIPTTTTTLPTTTTTEPTEATTTIPMTTTESTTTTQSAGIIIG